jgi:PBSX family phage terminase large subunit
MRGIMLRKTQEDLTASALVTYQERVLGAGHFGVRPFGGSKLKPAGFQYPNGSELLIGGLDKADKVMSREYDLIYVNEAWELSEDDLEKLSTRARWGVMPYQQIFGDTNPQGPSHHLHKAWVAGKLTMLFSVHKDNPSLWNQAAGDWTDLGRDYLARLDNLTGHRRQRLLDGVWVAAEGVVYPEFNRQTHVQSVDCTGWGTVLGLDVGTRNPTALLTIRHAGDRIHIEHEVYERGLSSDAITDTAVVAYQRSGAAMLVIDPSAAGLIASLVARSIPARKADNDVKVGISRVTSVIPDLTIDPSCENTIREFESYRYPDRGQSQDVPVKEHDHAMDAFRYGVMEIESALTGVLFV